MPEKPEWRLLDTAPEPAAFNMALDEALLQSAMSGSPPALRFFAWERPSVSLGRFQRASDIDLEYCAARAIPVVRRPTGGRAILHGHELTYSFTANSDDRIGAGLFESYGQLGRAFMMAFTRLGLDVRAEQGRGASRTRSPLCFRTASYAELTVGGRKIIGSAQRRRAGAMLQQGSIPFSLDREGVLRVFRNATPAELDRMAGINEFKPALTVDGLKRALADAFAECFGVSLRPGEPAEEEIHRAHRLSVDRYTTEGWTLHR